MLQKGENSPLTQQFLGHAVERGLAHERAADNTRAHDPEALTLVGKAFDNAWGKLASRGLVANPMGLRTTISRRTMAAVLIGVRDVDRLTLLALDAVDQSDLVQPRHIEGSPN